MFVSWEICKRQADEWVCDRRIALFWLLSLAQTSRLACEQSPISQSSVDATDCLIKICIWHMALPTHNSRINSGVWFLYWRISDICLIMWSFLPALYCHITAPDPRIPSTSRIQSIFRFFFSFIRALSLNHLHLLHDGHDGTRSLAEAWMGRSLHKRLQNHGCA